MDIDRNKPQPTHSAEQRIKFCLDQFEKAINFKKGIEWETDVVPHLTIEEIIGALVSAEQEIRRIKDDELRK